MASVADQLEAEGRREGWREGLVHQLRIRFGELPEAVVARLNAADIEELYRFADRVLTAPTLDDVLAGD